ncbi:MAG: hypothetical protein JWP42_4404 [Pseudomonas sp.]|nr:hypothetical protein [Pseudomonas sp.]
MDKSTFDLYLANGNITIFCGEHTDEFKSDVLNSSLFAELVSTKRTNDPGTSWLTFTDIVSKLEWVIKSRETQRKEFAKTNLLNIIMQSAALSSDEHEALESAFSKLKSLEHDSLTTHKFIDKLNINMSAATGGTHTLLTIVNKQKSLLTLQVSFKSIKALGIDILDRPVLMPIADGKNNIRLLRSALDEVKYNEVRETVIKKLGSKIDTDLVHVPH